MLQNHSQRDTVFSPRFLWLVAGAGVATTLLAVNMIATAKSIHRLKENTTSVAQAYETMAQLENVLSLVKDAETGQRGFLITGDPDYLEPYNRSTTEIAQAVEEVARFTATDVQQQAQLPTLRDHVNRTLSIMETQIRLRQSAGFEAARQMVLTGQAKAEMDRTRAIVAEMVQLEREQFQVRSQYANRAYRTAILTGLISGSLALAALAAFLIALRKYLNARDSAANSIAAQAEKLKITLASIGDGVITTDAQGRVTNFNTVAEMLTGWTTKEAVSQPLEQVFEIVNESSRQRVPNPVFRALAEGTIVGLANHTVLIAKDGTERPIDDSAAPIRAPSGEIMGCVLVFRDVSDRQQQERQLRDSRERLDLALSAAEIGQWDLNLIDNTAERTLQHDRIFGYEALLPEWTYGKFLEHVFPQDRVAVEAAFQQAISTGNPWNIECRIRRTDGAKRWIWVKSVVQQNAAGQSSRMLGMVGDITRQRQAESDLRESEQRFRQIADTMPQIVWVTRPNGYHEYYNRRWYDYIGCTPEDCLGNGWSAPLHPEDQRRAIDRWSHSLRTGEPYEIEYRLRAHTGEYRWFLGRALPVKNDTGQITRWFGTCTDIEDFKRAEAERNQLAADLSEADRRKDEFLATLAHELRNPLAPIRNGLQILQRTHSDNETTERIQSMMSRQLNQMVRLVDDLMDVSRISRGKVILRPEPVEISAIIEQAVEACRPDIEAAQQVLTITLPSQPAYLQADSMRLVQVFSNLLNNASKYSEPGAEISLSAEPIDQMLTVSIKDTGIGIAADMLPRIFNLFTQVEGAFERASGPAAATNQGGLGIGLTLVKQLVEMHEGSVQAYSAGLEQGSEFVVQLPMIPPPAEAVDAGESSLLDSSIRRVLIVDDNEDSAMTLAMLFEIIGDKTQTAHDGLEAVKIANTFRPEIILLDIGLPGLNGYEVAERIRQQLWGEAMILVALTGWGQVEDRQKSSAAGFDAHMVKPVDHDALLALLQALMDGRPNR